MPISSISGDDNFQDPRFPVQYVNRPNLDFRGFCGTIASLRDHFACEANDESLEEIYFQATSLSRDAAAAIAAQSTRNTIASEAHSS